MKKLLFLLSVLLGYTYNLNAQFTTGHFDRIYPINWNNVGNSSFGTTDIIQEMLNINVTGNENYPLMASYPYGILLNYTTATSGGKAQVYISHAGNDLIFRGGWGGNDSWQSWNKVLTHLNFGQYALPLTGGTLTGALNIIRTDAQTANANLNLGTSDGHFTHFMASAGGGNYNDIVQAGDHAIIYSDGTYNSGSFTIAPWFYGTAGLRMDNGGNVSIGTAFSKGYKLAVNGPAIFTKAVVKNYSNWPDYVFDSSYQLPSLDSVSTFIQANKHLPDMPSTATVEKDGHDLGEVQKLLLKKVEELTLYVIEQNKVIIEQGKEIEKLKSKDKSK